jgi:hypothetical protein
MIKSIEISLEAAKQLLPCLEMQLRQAEEECEQWYGRVQKLKLTITELRAKINGSELPLVTGDSYRKRLPKGRGADVIATLFESLPDGTVLSMADIKSRTGLKHATVYRTLTEPNRNKGRFVMEGKGWKAVQRRLLIRL